MNGENLIDHRRDHPARYRVDGPFADRHGKSRLGHLSHAYAPLDDDFRLPLPLGEGRGEGNRRMNLRTIGHIRIVPAILDRVTCGKRFRELLAVQMKTGRLPHGKGQFHLAGQTLLPEHECSSFRCRSSTGARGVAVSQFPFLHPVTR